MANEKRLIDANALMESIYDTEYSICCPLDEVSGVINDAPTVDAVEVVHGRWLYDSGSGKYFCSECDKNALSFRQETIDGTGELFQVFLTDYCPNCGAKMDGDVDG